MKTAAALFGTGYLQVLLVAVNTYQISHEHYAGAGVVGFLISFVWTFNVHKIAFGTLTDRITYSSGAALGTLTGLATAHWFYS